MLKRTDETGGMIRVEVRKIPKKVVSMDEFLAVDDVRLFNFEIYRLLDSSINR